MRVVWMVIVAATGAMFLIAAGLVAQPHKRSEFFPSFKEGAEFHLVCGDCGHEHHANGGLIYSDRSMNN